MKISKKFGVFKLLLLCFIVAVVSAVPTLAVMRDKTSGIEENLKENLSEFQGVLTIWNVDTFEGGSQSKTVFLEEVSRQFSNVNKGLFFIIKNLSVEEMTQNFIEGVYPDIISFGTGIGDLVEPMLSVLDANSFKTLRTDVLGSGVKNGELKSVGFLMGGYILASTEEKVGNAGVDASYSLVNVLNNAGFDYETKNGTKHTASVIYGENNFIKPEIMSEIAFGLTLEDKFVSKTMYDAYVDFVGYNKGTILVGTHRDLFKLSGRIKVGKINGVRLEYINSYTNLVQYAGVIKGRDEIRMEYSKKFIEFLLSVDSQSICTKIGMVNVIGEQFYEEGELANMEDALSGSLIIPNIFSA